MSEGTNNERNESKVIVNEGGAEGFVMMLKAKVYSTVGRAARIARRALIVCGATLFGVWLLPYNHLWKIRFLQWLSTSRIPKVLNDKVSPFVLITLFVLFATNAVRAKRARSVTPSYVSSIVGAYEYAIGLVVSLFLGRAYRIVRYNDVNSLVDLESNASQGEIIDFDPSMSKRLLSVATSAYRSICEPVFFGMKNVPTLEEENGPLLFVSNHSILAFELPLLLDGLAREKGIVLRPLADHAHFQIPINGRILRNVFGVVEGTPTNAELLFRAHQAVLVYPGGARETFKRTTDELYELKWGERAGFARLAIQHGVTIIPISNVGWEDMIRVEYDMPLSWIPVPFLYSSDRTFPLFSPPNVGDLQRVYFRFGRPIRTAHFRGNASEENVRFIRDETKRRVEDGIKLLQAYQLTDQSRYTSDRISRDARRRFQALRRWLEKVTARNATRGSLL